MNVFESAMKFLGDNMGSISMVLGVFFSISKVVSNEKAGPVVAKIQVVVDGLAKLVASIGMLLKMISDILANLIKSDGILGKK